MTENSEDTDSDFEDPDTVAVPQTLRSAGGAGGDKKAAPTVIEDGSDDDIEVISSTKNGTKFGFGGMGKPGGGSLLKTKQLEDQGFEVIKEVPGSAMGAPRMGNPFASAMFGSNPNLTSMAALLAGGSMGNMGNMSSLLAGMAQGSSSLMNQSNMLQKSLENGSG